jgi:hypothetical protein
MIQRWREAGGTDEDALRAWFVRQGVTDTHRIRRDDYDDLVAQLLIDLPGVVPPVAVEDDHRTRRALATRAPAEPGA